MWICWEWVHWLWHKCWNFWVIKWPTVPISYGKRRVWNEMQTIGVAKCLILTITITALWSHYSFQLYAIYYQAVHVDFMLPSSRFFTAPHIVQDFWMGIKMLKWCFCYIELQKMMPSWSVRKILLIMMALFNGLVCSHLSFFISLPPYSYILDTKGLSPFSPKSHWIMHLGDHMTYIIWC